MVTTKDIERSISFNEYYALVEKLANEGGTTGNDQSKTMINYTKLNFSRMKRILKTTEPIPEVKETLPRFSNKVTWLIISESWCGDAAQNIPVMQKMAEISSNINVRIIMRDENPDLMIQYLTNGSKSIPKLICLDENLTELGTWGPRPKVLQDWLKKEKNNPTMEMSELKEQFQVWYIKDKGQTLQKEMLVLMKDWLKKDYV